MKCTHCAAEEVQVFLQQEQVRNDPPSRLACERDLGRVAAERGNIVARPLEREHDVAQAEVASFVVGGFFAVPAESVRESGDEG